MTWRALALQAGFSPNEPRPAAAALDALRKAVEYGFDNVYKLKNDENLAPVRQRKDFQSLVDDTESRAHTAATRDAKSRR